MEKWFACKDLNPNLQNDILRVEQHVKLLTHIIICKILLTINNMKLSWTSKLFQS